MSDSFAAPVSGVSLFDARAFFEKALAHGLAHGIIDGPKLDAIAADAPKGMVQIARYFGNEFLRPDLEKARDRLVNLVSLHLEHSSGGDLRVAAELLRDHSFLSRSKAGSDMLKAMIGMPVTSHFGMNERAGFQDSQIPLLAKWALKSLPDYQAELAKRAKVALVIDAALWLAESLGLDAQALEEAGKDAEALIRTALLLGVLKRTDIPDWVAFQKLIAALRKKYAGLEVACPVQVPKNLPAQFKPVVQFVCESVAADWPRILDISLSARRLFDQTPAFMGRYFWLEDGLSEVDHFDRATSQAWQKATDGHTDDSALLTLFLCVAVGNKPKTLLTEKSATTLIRKIRKTGLQPSLASDFIRNHAPEQHQYDYAQLWDDFLEEARPTLQSDMDYALNDALALLRRECNVVG
jgi:hypothetical protein